MTTFARAFITAHREANVATVAKHFPGHGLSWGDSHKVLPVVLGLNAGIDLLVFSNVKSHDPDLGTKLHGIIAAAVRDGRIPHARIEVAYGRIAELKRRLMQHDLAGTR